MTDKKALWDRAGKAGLVLGLVSCAYLLINGFTAALGSGNALGAAAISILNAVLWLAKLVGCVLLMKMFMKRFAAATGADNSDTFKFGIATALLSALIFAAFCMAYYSFIQPDALTQSFDMMMEGYSDYFTSDMMESVEKLSPRMPTYMFFTQLFYCFIYGLVLSAILSRNIPSRNPFERRVDEQ